MIGVLPALWPVGAAHWTRQARRLMDVILHMGAHRTATTTFQNYVRDQRAELAAEGTQFWGPKHVRSHVFPGLFRNSVARKGRNVARRAEGRVRLLTEQASRHGVQTLLISDENMLGTCRDNLRAERLYPAAGERTARLAAAFGGRLRRIVLTIRSQDLWWASACALTVSRGHAVPHPDRLAAIAWNSRNWRDVITDIACAAPEAQLTVLPFESHAGRPDRVLATALEIDAAPDDMHRWSNRSPDLSSLRKGLKTQGSDPDLLPDETGRWQPFDAEQTALLREHYADDLHWLTAGADGLATLTEDKTPTRATQKSPPGIMKKGQGNDQYQLQGELAQDG